MKWHDIKGNNKIQKLVPCTKSGQTFFIGDRTLKHFSFKANFASKNPKKGFHMGCSRVFNF